VVEIELSRNEDSVTSLAISQSSETSLTALAGINSSETDQKAGKNQHLRAFRLEYPRRRKADNDTEKPAEYSGKTEALGQTALFSRPQGEKDGIYQRIIRLSPSSNTSQRPVAAISTGLAIKGEIVVFRSDSSLTNPEVLGRITLDKEEAADLDIWSGEEADTAVLSYCTPLEVFIYAISLSKSAALSEPIRVYSIPAPDPFKSQIRPKLRSLRFLSPKHILLLANRPQRAGADLIVLKLDQLGNAGNSTLQKRLNKSTKAAVGLEVCFLSTSPTGERQILIAVAGQDGSIEILTMDYSPKKGLGTFKPYTIIRDIHPASITKLAFSTFHAPPHPITSSTRPQSIKLASVSVGQTVIVHTLPLEPTTKPPSRYILARPPTSQTLQNTFSVVMAILVIGLSALLLQAFTEIRLGINTSQSYLGASHWVSPQIRELMQKPFFAPQPPIASVSSAVSSATTALADVASTAPSKLSALLSAQAEGATNSPSSAAAAIIVRHSGSDSSELHAAAADAAALVGDESLRKWDELSQDAKRGWLRRLREAGHWAEEQGEAVLKGVFFSEVAGAIAGAVGG
jgi:glycyl-tRNA synthetase